MSGQRISGRLIAAARALAGVGRADFAAAAGLTPNSLRLIEGSGSAWLHSQHETSAVLRAFDHFGILIVEEADGFGAGVRLKFTRQDVRQLARLEGEGGIVGSDDAP
ncbi:MAG: XRE family transcriptional regulator [Sphingomonadales bacterium]|nr:MAG: XRE family transcriptional regulator [Sphingomonadales bacterium]